MAAILCILKDEERVIPFIGGTLTLYSPMGGSKVYYPRRMEEIYTTTLEEVVSAAFLNYIDAQLTDTIRLPDPVRKRLVEGLSPIGQLIKDWKAEVIKEVQANAVDLS